MTDQISFRTNDNTRWGTGTGQNLTPTQVDINFWVLWSAVQALQDHQDASASISYITVTGNQMVIHLTNHVALGPFTLPTATFNWRGAWQADQTYNVNDIFTSSGAVYMCIWPVTNSGSAFNPYQNDGNGHDWWATLLEAPASELPPDGNPGSVLMMSLLDSPGSAEWVNLTRNIALYIESEPNPLEEVLAYVVPEQMTVPQGATGSVAKAGTQPTTNQVYEFYWNGANVGSLTFEPSPDTPAFSWPHAITFEPGDLLTVVAPSVPDPHLTRIAFTLVGTLP